MRRLANKHNLGLAVVLMVASVIPTQEAELGHYSPALPAIPDFILPDPGFY